MLLDWIKKRFFPTTGAWGERKAAAFLQDKGVKVLRRNYMAGHDELDIIAQDRKGLVFVEVRTRQAGALVPGSLSLSTHKRRALRRGINHYLRQQDRQGNPAASWRFDVVEISYKTRRKYEIYHYPGSEL